MQKKGFCQAQVQIQSRSIPGPFQIYFKSFQSISIQNQMIWTRSWCYFHCATHHHQQTFVWLLITSNPYCITSNHLRMVLDDIEDPIPVRMTPYPLRLQLQSLLTGVILMGKMTFWGYKCLTKVVHTMITGILNITTPLRMTPMSSQTPTSDFVDKGYLDREKWYFGEQSDYNL